MPPVARCEYCQKCSKTGMKKYLRVPEGTGSPKPRPAEGYNSLEARFAFRRLRSEKSVSIIN